MKNFFQIPQISISKINEKAEKLNCIRFDKSRTKILIFNSPENPTGKVYSKEEVENLVSLAKKKKESEFKT